jgi:hypothetical protein
MKRWSGLLGAVSFVAMSSVAVTASADYICNTNYFPGSGARGTEGYVYFNLYSAPNCTGSFVSTRYLCSTGATSTSCISNSSYWFERAGLLAMFSEMTRAADVGQGYSVAATGTCIGGAAGCFAYGYFSGN